MLVTNYELYKVLLQITMGSNIISTQGEYGGWNPGKYVRAKTRDGIFVFEIRESTRFNKKIYRLVLGSESYWTDVIENFPATYASHLFSILSSPDFNFDEVPEKKIPLFKKIFNRSK